MRKLFTGLCLVGVLFSCQSSKTTSTVISVVSLRGPSALSLVNMMDQIQDLNGISIDYRILSEPNQVRLQLIQEKVDIAMVPTNMAAILYNKDIPYRVAMVPVWGSLYLCGYDHEISDLKELRNKRVYSMARGLNPDIILRALLQESGIDPNNDVQIDYSFPGHIDLANAVRAKRADLAILSEPQLSLAIQENPDIRIYMDINEEWEKAFGYGIPQTAVLVRNSLLENQPKLVSSIILEIERSATKANSSIESTAYLGEQFNILPNKQALLDAIPRSHILPIRGSALKAPLATYLKVFYNFKPESIGGKIPDENFIITE